MSCNDRKTPEIYDFGLKRNKEKRNVHLLAASFMNNGRYHAIKRNHPKLTDFYSRVKQLNHFLANLWCQPNLDKLHKSFYETKEQWPGHYKM